MPVNRSVFALFCAVVLALVFPCSVVAERVERPPNIVFILIDDMGWMDCGAYGSTYYQTPAIDRLASQGMRFTDAYAQPLCSPTRAALMSGQYPCARLGLHKAITGGSVDRPAVPERANANTPMCWPTSLSHLPAGVYTLAEALRDGGYQTWFLGKWHLGHKPSQYPVRQGFNLNIGVGGAGPRGGYFAPWSIPELPPGPDGEYVADRLADEACALIDRADDKPFFMYLCHFNVHAPYEAKPELVEQYRQRPPGDNGQRHPIMGAMIHAMDDSVGRVLNKLDESGLAQDTIVVFMSDNGGINWGDKRATPELKGTPVTSNAPLRGGKASFYEGGVRVPLIVRWPGQVEAGSVQAAPVHAIDWYPTLLDAAGLDAPPDKVLDGVSLLPTLAGEGPPDREALFCHFPRNGTTASDVGGSFVRVGDYKLIRLWGGGPGRTNAYELYDLANDLGETTNLAEQMPERVEDMARRLDQWLEDTGALIPRPNPDYRAR